jgi:hypothetical protein
VAIIALRIASQVQEPGGIMVLMVKRLLELASHLLDVATELDKYETEGAVHQEVDELLSAMSTLVTYNIGHYLATYLGLLALT